MKEYSIILGKNLSIFFCYDVLFLYLVVILLLSPYENLIISIVYLNRIKENHLLTT